MKRWLALAVFLASCAPRWDLGRLFAPLAVDTDQVMAGEARAAFADALEQLGGRVGQSGQQQVRLGWDQACSCSSCTAQTAAHTDWVTRKIWICPWSALAGEGDVLGALVIHELGHVLGDPYHLPCDSGAVMAPEYHCEDSPLRYGPADIAAICGAGEEIGRAHV